MAGKKKAKEPETIRMLNYIVRLPETTHLPNWLRIVMQSSSPSPFIINRNDGDLFDRIHQTARLNPEAEAIIRLLAMVAYQDLKTHELEAELNRMKQQLAEHLLERGS